jgi:hypothetical protein
VAPKKELICGTLAPNMAANHNHKKKRSDLSGGIVINRHQLQVRGLHGVRASA